MFSCSDLTPLTLFPHQALNTPSLINHLCLGFDLDTLIRAEQRRLRRIEAASKPKPSLETGTYVPKFEWTEVPNDLLAPTLPPSVWRDWEGDKCALSLTRPSWISADNLVQLAQEIDFPDQGRVARTAAELRNGVRTGVQGAGRLPLPNVRNSPSLNQMPRQVLDTLRTWTRKELLCGPLKKDELPEGAKLSPLSAVLKPNMDAR